MWPFTKRKSNKEKSEQAKRDLSDLVAGAVWSRRPYIAQQVLYPLIELYKKSTLDVESKKLVVDLLNQFVEHCECDGWVNNPAYVQATTFIKEVRFKTLMESAPFEGVCKEKKI